MMMGYLTPLPGVLPVQIARVGSTTYRVGVQTLNASLALATPSSVTVTTSPLAGTDFYTESTGAPPVAPRIVNPSTGVYYIELGASTGTPATNHETAGVSEILVTWSADFGAEGWVEHVQAINIVTGLTRRRIAEFSEFIDKARKDLDVTDQLNPTVVGYTDGQLYLCLKEGLSVINAYQPVVVFDNIDNYPDTHSFLLYEAALYAGILMQTIFAIDTDLPSYTDLGGSWAIPHHPQLAALLQMVVTRLDKAVPDMKKQFVSMGGMYLEIGPSFRYTTLLSAAPTGLGFRNLWYSA